MALRVCGLLRRGVHILDPETSNIALIPKTAAYYYGFLRVWPTPHIEPWHTSSCGYQSPAAASSTSHSPTTTTLSFTTHSLQFTITACHPTHQIYCCTERFVLPHLLEPRKSEPIQSPGEIPTSLLDERERHYVTVGDSVRFTSRRLFIVLKLIYGPPSVTANPVHLHCFALSFDQKAGIGFTIDRLADSAKRMFSCHQ
jgi:hypothetical protein